MEAQRLKLEEQQQSLLNEQERLRQILADQEMLLLNKQQQLRQQHIRQQERLQQFQLTGTFPDVGLMEAVAVDVPLNTDRVVNHIPAADVSLKVTYAYNGGGQCYLAAIRFELQLSIHTSCS